MLGEQQALEIIRLGELEFPPLTIELVDVQRESELGRADWVLALTFDGRRREFIVEYSRYSTPRALDQATSQLDRFVRLGDDSGLNPMLMAPYLSDAMIAQLVRQRVSGIDFSGNGVVYVPGEWFVQRTGAKNKFPASAPIKKIYRGRSSLVGRVLLEQRKFKTVSEVRDAIAERGATIALSTVSKVLSRLEDELIVAKDPTIRLLQPGKLLANLRSEFSRPVIEQKVAARTDLASSLLSKLVDRAQSSGVQLALDGSERYALLAASRSVTRVYISGLNGLLAGLDLDTTSPFADLEILVTPDPLVFFDLRWAEGVPWTSPLQAYLELSAGGKREKEAAEQLVDSLIGTSAV